MNLWGWLGTPAFPVDPSRWVMVDVETSGLDARRDRLLAIAAIALQVDWVQKRLVIVPGDSFEVELQQEVASTKDNILLHGIGAQRQRAGVEVATALKSFSDFVGASPLLAFHAWFDQRLIQRYSQAHGGAMMLNPWVDVEHLCAVTHPKVKARSLDDWMAHFNIHCAQRHQAAADTFAECEILLRIWPQVAAHCENWRDVQRMARRLRWLGR